MNECLFLTNHIFSGRWSVQNKIHMQVYTYILNSKSLDLAWLYIIDHYLIDRNHLPLSMKWSSWLALNGSCIIINVGCCGEKKTPQPVFLSVFLRQSRPVVASVMQPHPIYKHSPVAGARPRSPFTTCISNCSNQRDQHKSPISMKMGD